jgi:Fatty acid desaturase
LPRPGDDGVMTGVRRREDPDGSLPTRDRPERSWRAIAAPYARPDPKRAIAQLLNTALPFVILMAALLYGIGRYGWAALPVAIPAAALLVRLFMIQHDCGHGSFFNSRWANDLLGRTLGVLTLTPYAFWRRSHAIHHATSGNVDRRGVGDVTTITVREYLQLPTWRRLLYRIYRHPVVLFGLGPTYLFVIRCFAQNAQFRQAKRLSLRDSLRCPRLALWDEEKRTLIAFREVADRAAPRPAAMGHLPRVHFDALPSASLGVRSPR